jgi:hypothetical protein
MSYNSNVRRRSVRPIINQLQYFHGELDDLNNGLPQMIQDNRYGDFDTAFNLLTAIKDNLNNIKQDNRLTEEEANIVDTLFKYHVKVRDGYDDALRLHRAATRGGGRSRNKQNKKNKGNRKRKKTRKMEKYKR